MLSFLKALNEQAAERGDGLRTEFLTHVARYAQPQTKASEPGEVVNRSSGPSGPARFRRD